PATHFAPPERAAPSEVEQRSREIAQDPLFQAILESVDGFLMILNPQRQVLAVNTDLLRLLGIEDVECLLGDRPGEIIGCIHAPTGPGGCGTAKACASCGAVLSILRSQSSGEPTVGECLVTVNEDHTEPMEFRVRASPIRVGEHEFTVLVFSDISAEKRREALERTFFHDVRNTLGGLLGWSTLLESAADLDPREAAGRIVALSRRLSQEIEDQRRMSQAERGEIEIDVETKRVEELWETLTAVFDVHEAAQDRHLEIMPAEPDDSVTTDVSLLMRVLTNMTKNALEACLEGETVRVWFERRDGESIFHVGNPSEIPEDVALRIFQRSFSTKGGRGRGIGTYSMKLFGEKILGGRVWFETGERGTVFSIALPECSSG
ncbi:HAMP domain-containing histidine kinase, partial [Candidatus Sumerlaeota bacterium]|nr:HAMP domain-containing histidine kinase [Candidatus Sumerlaeota bacterium]